MQSIPACISVLLTICLLLSACSPVAEIPARGQLFGEMVETTVDSEVAHYYLSTYLQGKTERPDLDKQIAAIYAQQGAAIPSRAELASIAQSFSVDFASLFLADRLLTSECNKILNQAFAGYLKSTGTNTFKAASYRVLFVPGWDYAANGHVTGADFAKPRKLATQFGLDNVLVELPPTGSVDQNADFLAAEVRKHNMSGKKIVLAGASSAGPAIHLALSERLSKSERGAIKAWLNLGGILQGSPLIDMFQSGSSQKTENKAR